MIKNALATKAILAIVSIAARMAWAQTALTPPQAGFIQDGANSFRPVFGIAGNFLPGDPMASSVVSAAYSGSYGLVKTSSAILVIDRDGSIAAANDAPDGPALFAFTRTGEPSLAYLTTVNMLLAWNGESFEAVPFDPTTLAASAVLSIALPHSRCAAMIVQRDDGLWEVQIELGTGAIEAQTALTGVTAPVLILATGQLVYADDSGILIRNSDGSERHISAQLPPNFALQQMGDRWIQIRDLTGGQQFAIRITENREQYYQLPEARQ
jgi:hypothetical protein